MLYLDVSGRGPTRRCKEAVEWFMKENLLRFTIDISVVHRGLKREGVYGWCTVEDSDYRPRAFLIEVHNKLDFENYLKTLFHELWHVYQYVKGDLKELKSKKYWKGTLIDDYDYWDDPSEIEAACMEDILTEKYLLDKDFKVR
jgi:hypothetical protein